MFIFSVFTPYIIHWIFTNQFLSAAVAIASHMLSLMTLFLLNLSVNSFRLVGDWRLTNIYSYPIIGEKVTLSIEDYIFRSTEILQKLSFQGCQTYSYILETNQKSLFIHYTSQNIQNVANLTQCSAQLTQMHQQIRNVLRKSFNFKIVGNLLAFLDLQNRPMLTFEATVSPRPRNIRGVWDLYQLNGQKTQLQIQVADTQMALCDRLLTIGYSYGQKYQIRTRLIEDQGCQVPQLKETLLSAKFFRRYGGRVDILNQNLQLILKWSFKSALNLTQVQKNNTNPVQNTSFPQNLLGSWKPSSILGIPLPSTSVSLNFTKSQIIYDGGCNRYIFQYTVDVQKQQILVGRNKSTTHECQIDDDGLYVNAIEKMNKYSLISNQNQIIFRSIDSDGNNVFELIKTLNNSSQNKTKQNSVGGLKQGHYVFLILSRRDLPHKFCTVTSSMITYEGCNTIQHTYKLSDENQIIITGGAKTQKTCSNNNDQIMFNIFNSVKYFQIGRESGSYLLKDQNNQTIINLSLF